MIRPVLGEAAWRAWLDTLPLWQPPLVPSVILSPHPDDETLGAGGLIAWLRLRDIPVTILAVTDGEHAYTELAGKPEPRLAACREEEQKQASARLGVNAENIVRLRLPDSGVAGHEAQLVEALLAHVPAGAHLVAPWPHDFHPDHEVCGRAARKVATEKSLSLTSYFFWTWHRGALDTLAGCHLQRFPLTSAEMSARHEALMCHRSQLQHSSGEPILPSSLLGPLDRPYEVFLPS